MKKKFIISMIFILSLLLAACSPQPLQTINSDKYYLKITSNGEEVDFGEEVPARYAYELDGYDKDSESKNLSFTANHQLKKGAFLKIYYKDNKVITYEEVDFDDIPEMAKQFLTEDSED